MPNLGQNWRFFVLRDLEVWRVTLINIRAPLLTYFKLCASFCSLWRIQTGVTVRKRSIWVKICNFFVSCDLEIWQMTLKNNRAPLLCYLKLCAWFQSHLWIQTRVTVQRPLNWVLTSVTLTFDLLTWPFAWTLLLSMVITPENFLMIWWQENSEKGVTDKRTDRQIDRQKCSYSCLFTAKNTVSQNLEVTLPANVQATFFYPTRVVAWYLAITGGHTVLTRKLLAE